MKKYFLSSALGLLLLLLAGLPIALPAQGLQLRPGIYWVATGTVHIILYNTGIVNNGRFVPGNSTLLLTGDDPTAVSYIGGNQTVALYDVVVATASRYLRLDNDLTLSHSITLDSGNLDLNGHLLDLGSTGNIMGERNGACITGVIGGSIRRTAVLNTPRDADPGNIGVAISSSADLGVVTIVRSHVAQAVAYGVTGIQRYFDLEPAVNGGLEATLRLHYLDGELAGNRKPRLVLFYTPDAGAGWQELGAAHNSMDSNWVVQTHLDHLHRFTLATGASAAAESTSMEAYPNPTQDVFQLKLTSPEEKNTTIGLYDASGHLVEVKRVRCLAGTTIVEWRMERYAAGVYYVGIQGQAAPSLKLIRL